MHTDEQLYLIFKNNPAMLKELMGIESDLAYRFDSVALKDMSRTVDGYFHCDQADKAYIIEFT